MIKEINNMEDVLDVRDIIERYEELERELQAAYEEMHGKEPDAIDLDNWVNIHRDNSDPIYAAFDVERGHEVQESIEEFYKLTELLEDLRGAGGDEQWDGSWFPLTLIRDSYFRDYAEELAEDIGAINREGGWPNNHIDWDSAARALQTDYSTVEFDGVTYWYR